MDVSKLLQNLPNDLVTILLDEFNKLHTNYFLGKWGPSELNGGRFGEIVLRIIEYKDINIYTPIGTQLQRRNIVNRVVHNRSLHESYRLQIPVLTELLMDFRNNRNVAHVGTIDVNEMDSSFVIHTANWIISELIRLENGVSPAEAQRMITKIIERKVPIIEEIDGRLKILNPKLIVKDQILVFCYKRYPNKISEEELFAWCNEKNRTRLRGYLSERDREKLIDYYNNEAVLTKRGVLWVEKNIDFDLGI